MIIVIGLLLSREGKDMPRYNEVPNRGLGLTTLGGASDDSFNFSLSVLDFSRNIENRRSISIILILSFIISSIKSRR